MRRCILWFLILTFTVLCGQSLSTAYSQEITCANGAIVEEASDYDRCSFFKNFNNDDKTIDSRVLSQLGISANLSSRSIAIVVAIEHYKMPGNELPPAKVDGDNLERFLIDNQHFDEVIVLRDKEATKQNIEYFLVDYVNQQYALYQGRTRILFAYSGHGSPNVNITGASLVLSDATSMVDLPHLMPLSQLNGFFHQVSQYNFQLLALINACYGGDVFQTAREGGNPFISSAEGAHALTAGSPDELVWSLPGKKSGSIFFDTLIKGIESGDADKSNHVVVSDKNGNTYIAPTHIIRLGSLLQYLTEQIIDLGYHYPWFGSVNITGKPSVGAFFFLGPQNDKVTKSVAESNPGATLITSTAALKTNLGISYAFLGGAISSIPAHPELKVFNPPEDYSIQGVDISQFNHVDWSKVIPSEIGFVYIRATGISGVDKKFASNWLHARRKGIVRGAYHYFSICEDPSKQYARIAKTVSLSKGDLPIAIDLDWPPTLVKQQECASKLGKDKVASRVLSLVDMLYKHYGRQPVIYGNQHVFNDLLMAQERKFTIWLGEREKLAPEAKLGGNKPWSFWQYTARKLPQGFASETDASVFFGTRKDFDEFIAGNDSAVR